MRSVPFTAVLLSALAVLGLTISGIAFAVPAIDPDDRAAIRRAFDDGQYQEVYAALEARLFDADGSPSAAADVALASEALEKLGLHAALDPFWTRSLEKYATNADVHAAAAKAISSARHYGFQIAGEFERGGRRERGATRVSSELYDRALALRWYRRAIELHAQEIADPSVEQQSKVGDWWNRIAQELWSSRYAAWRLLDVTDLDQLPDFDPGWPGYGSNRGAPVDDDGKPVLHDLPGSWRDAKSDGERWRFALSEASRLMPGFAAAAHFERARFAIESFSVDTTRGALQQANDLGILDLKSLRDNETIAKLATGIARFELPAGQHPIALLERAAELGGEGSVAETARDQLATRFENRQQFVRAAEQIRENISIHGVGHERSREKRLHSIVKPRGQFESLPVQCAGEKAKLALQIRNATRGEFTAQRIDREKLVAESIRYLNSRPRRIDSDKIRLEADITELVAREREKYLLGDPVEWSAALESPSEHFSTSVEIDTPLSNAGAYFVECELDGETTFRTILWIEDILAVRKPLREGGAWYAVVDARSGEPVAGATLDVFGYQMNWIRDTRDYDCITRSFELETDDGGQAIAPESVFDGLRYFVTVVKTPDGRTTTHGFESIWRNFSTHTRNRMDGDSFFLLTDRPVYRPGHSVHVHAWKRHASYTHEGHRHAGTAFQVRIDDPRGEKVLETSIVADDHGGFGVDLDLDDPAPLGQYGIKVDGRWVGSFRVEEYVKPEFEVTVEAPTDFVRLGDRAEATIHANYYTGPPVTSGTVHYKILRTKKSRDVFFPGEWDWLYGAGYGYTGRTPRSYPGAERFGCFIPTWGYRSYESPELIAEATVPIGADGTVKVPVDTSATKILHGDSDHQYRVVAEVRDESRRTIAGSGSFVVAREPFDVHLTTNGGYYRVGDKIEIRARAWTANDAPVSGPGSLRLSRVTGPENEVEDARAPWPVEFADDGTAQAAIDASRPGQYRLELTVERDGTTRKALAVFRVLGADETDAEDRKNFVYDDLQITPRRGTHAPGDVADFLISTAAENSRVFLFERAESSKYPRPKLLRLSKHEGICSLSIDVEDMPNTFLEAMTIVDGVVHTVVERIVVPPRSRKLDLTIEPASSEYEPGDEASIDITLTDLDGNPVVGQTAITVYDRSLEQIAGGSGAGDIVSHFWNWTRNHRATTATTVSKWQRNHVPDGEPAFRSLGLFDDRAMFSLEAKKRPAMKTAARLRAGGAVAPAAEASSLGLASGDDFDAAAGEAGSWEDDGSGSGAAEPKLRSNFADTAFYSAPVVTDSNGRATVTFDMPDDLTSWRLQAWGVASGTRVGAASSAVTTRKPLYVRFQAPRFFTEGDHAVLSVNLHNQSPEDETVELELLDTSGLFSFESDRTRTVDIAKGDEVRVDWSVIANASGSGSFEVRARGRKYGDALVREIPIQVRGIERVDSFAGLLTSSRSNQAFTLTVPEASDVGSRALEFRVSANLARELLSAIPYLVHYPHGCTEQTLNRFLPALLVSKSLGDVGISLDEIPLSSGLPGKPGWEHTEEDLVLTSAKLDALVRTGLEKLGAQQLSDGGWGWFSGHGEYSSAHTTSVVVRGLLVARASGLEVPESMTNRGLDWLENHRKKELRRLDLPPKAKGHKAHATNTDALVHSVLCLGGRLDAGMAGHLFDDRLELTPYGMALAGIAFDIAEETARRDMVIRNLSQFEVRDAENGTRHLELPVSFWWRWYGSEIETHAMYIDLLERASGPEDESVAVEELGRYLLANRRHAVRWNSTRDTALVIEALLPSMKRAASRTEPVDVSLVLDGETIARTTLRPANLLAGSQRIEVPNELLVSGEHAVEVRSAGDGTVHWSAAFRAFDRSAEIAKGGLDLRVERRIYRLERKEASELVPTSTGQPRRQDVVEYERTRLLPGTPVDSGGLVEVELIIEAKNDFEYIQISDPKAAGFEPVDLRSGYVNRGLRSYAEFRDETVDFFAAEIPRGRHSLTYRVRAVTPGEFETLPTTCEAMYAPDLRGNSASLRVEVFDDLTSEKEGAEEL